MTDLFSGQTISLDEQIRELRREQQQRSRVYPKLIEQGRLTVKRATQQNRALDAALATLEDLHKRGGEP